jgi:endonuclease/exonuclease/phosphatase family metal-dependent hydrolase
MIGLIWNCQGLGRNTKFDFLREIIREKKVDFIGLQETKKTISMTLSCPRLLVTNFLLGFHLLLMGDRVAF